MAATKRGTPRWMKPAVFAAALAPLARIGYRFFADRYGANPIAAALNDLGIWTLAILLAALACTPLHRVAGWKWPLALRRMIGLFAFFYACLHFTLYVAVDQGFAWGEIGKDIAKRKFITVGFAALLLMLPLAVTSTNGMVRRLGFRRWKRLHRLVYLSGTLAIVHLLWRDKVPGRKQLAYATVLAILFAIRVADAVRRRRSLP